MDIYEMMKVYFLVNLYTFGIVCFVICLLCLGLGIRAMASGLAKGLDRIKTWRQQRKTTKRLQRSREGWFIEGNHISDVPGNYADFYEGT